MDATTRQHLDNIHSKDSATQNAAFMTLIAATDTQVDWAYEAWDDLLAGLTDKDNHVRAICAQLLCNLAKSDPEGRIIDDFEALLAVTHDDRFVTARHTLQNLWKIGLAGEKQQEVVIDGLAHRYMFAEDEKNGTLVRFDIIRSLKNLFDERGDTAIRAWALALIDREEDEKYRQKYAKVWK